MVRENEKGVSLARQLLRELIILAVIIIGIVATSLPAAILFQPETHATTKTTGAVLNAAQPRPLAEQTELKENVAFRPHSAAANGMH